MPNIRDRVRKIFSLIDHEVDCICLIKGGEANPSFSYITGLTKGLFEGSFVLVRRDGDIHIITSGLDKIEDDEFCVFIAKEKKDIENKIRELTKDVSVIGFDGRYTNFSDYRMIKKWCGKRKLKDVGKQILLARLQKDDFEVGLIKKACRLSDEVFDELIKEIKEGITERRLALKIEMLAIEIGGDGTSFKSIVAFGRNSAIPHHVPGNKRLRKKDIVLLDFGVRYKGYVSDITRSFVYGRADKRMRCIYDTVCMAQEIGRKNIREGTRFEDVHKRIHGYIEEVGFKGKFIHSSGHTIGLDVHDGFRLYHGCKERFLEGVTFTIEPGIYLKNIGGIRIEDDFVFSNGKAKRLTLASRFLEL